MKNINSFQLSENLKGNKIESFNEGDADNKKSAPPLDVEEDNTVVTSEEVVTNEKVDSEEKVFSFGKEKVITDVDDELEESVGQTSELNTKDESAKPKETAQVDSTDTEEHISNSFLTGKKVSNHTSFFGMIADTAVNFNRHPLQTTAKFLTASAQHKQYKKFVKNGKLVKAGEFMMVQYRNSLMVYRYSGAKQKIEIPAKVGGLPVQYVHSEFLNGNINPLKSHRFRALNADQALQSAVIGDDFIDLVLHGVSEVVLPNGLLALSGRVFAGCSKLEKLIVPASIQYFGNSVVSNSGIQAIVFESGSIPTGFDPDAFEGDVFIRKEDVE